MIALSYFNRVSSVLVLAASVALGACGGDSGADRASSLGEEDAARTLIVSQGSDVLSMDPYFKNESPTLGVLINMFDPLTDVAPDLTIQPALATSWENLGPLLWEFRLREGVKFSNGNDFDADDVHYSILRARDWAPSRQTSEVATVKDVIVIDEHTIQISTTQPDAILPTRLISIYMLDKETCEAGVAEDGEPWLATHPVGTGPYKLDKWTPGAQCTLVRNEHYWGEPSPIERVQFLAISNDTTRIAAFLEGNIDVLSHVPVRDVDRVRATPGYTIVSNPSLRLIYLGMDVGRDKSPGVHGSPPNPLKNPLVRKAMYAGINEDLIIEKVMHGQAKAAAQLFPIGVLGHDTEIERMPYDVEQAKRWMAEAGYAEGFDVRLDSPNDRYVNDAEISAAVAGYLAKINIRVAVNAQPKAVFFPGDERGEFSFFLLGWTNPNGDGYGTFDNLLHTKIDAKNLGVGNSSSLYSNAEFDRISQQATSEFDPAKREELLKQATRIAMEDLPHIPLHYQMDIYAISDRIEWTPRRDTQTRAIEVKWKP